MTNCIIWLLDYFSRHRVVPGKLNVAVVDFELILSKPEELARWNVPKIEVGEAEFETATDAWQAYRAQTPQACFDLMDSNLAPLPLLRPTLINLLNEPPSAMTGLGWTELRLLELIERGHSHANALFFHRGFGQRRVFNDWEVGYLLEGLAFGPKPAIAGLDEELRTIKREMTNTRLEAFRRSRLSVTDFGREVLRHKEDFSCHNPIDRWWGGTHLTNDRLWRLKPVLMKP